MISWRIWSGARARGRADDDEPGVEEDRLHAQKKTYGYQERDDTKRQCFLSHLSTLAPASLIYLDEAGREDNADYPWGWCAQGGRFFALKPGHRQQRVSLIAAVRGRDLIAPMTCEGYCDRNVFTAWLEQVLVPHLNPGDTVILDNASFPNGANRAATGATAGCHLLYLPSYSPDLNPIENRWASLKNTMCKNISRFPSFREAVDAAFVNAS